MGGQLWRLTGFIDSGNLLREPLSGKPVALVGKALMEEMLAGLSDARTSWYARGAVPGSGHGAGTAGRMEGRLHSL